VSLDGLLATLGERPRQRGEDFERICRWLLQSGPEYRTQLRKVWLWDDWPGRWAADAGIDLVAETHDGGLWAVQAKAYDPAYTIKKADIDSFLSESARSEFSYRLLIATTDRIGPNARRTLAGQEKPAGVLLRSQLALAEVAWPGSATDLSPPRSSRKRARPHQRKAVTAVVRGFRSNERGQLVMACGTGKTLVGCFLAKTLEARRVLVLVPSLSLVRQTLREWATASEFSYLAVCSDETVTGGQADAVVASTSELGFPVTTNPAEIARFLRRRSDAMRVVFSTYQSSARIAEAQAGRTPAFDLVIADEAHRCAGPEAGPFATVLDTAKIKARRRLFMTATPRYFTGRLRKEAKEADWEVASMDDEKKFGPLLHRLSFAEAIEQELLSDYQVAVVGVSDATYREYAERGVFVTADGETVTDARTLASQLGVLRAMTNYDLHRVVTFHSRIRTASAFARSLPEVYAWLPKDRRVDGSLWAEHVSGEMTTGERDSRLLRLAAVDGAQRGLLTNARCLVEGVDVPTLDGVAFIEPRRSQVDIVQAVGRAIRKAKDKTLGTVVIPVFVDEDTDAEQALESGEFDRVWQVVKALRAHDEVLAEELDELRRELGRRRTTGGRPGKIKLDLPIAVEERFARAFDTWLVEETTAPWEFWFGLLQQFAEREGHAGIPKNHVERGHRLGSWAHTQRIHYKAGRLSAERAIRLTAVDGWPWDMNDARWEEGFGSLVNYVARQGTAHVPQGHIEEGYPLGKWVNVQRRFRRAGKLSDVRAERLAAFPGWTWDSPDTRWEQRYAALERFVARVGHARVPHDHVEDGYQLGKWVVVQRSFHADGRLPDERVVRLAALPGWVWNVYDAEWERGFSALECFVEREGHARVPAKHIENTYRLGRWVVKQRHNKGQLAADRTSRLEAVPGWEWHARDAAWERGFQHLVRYIEAVGHARVPQSYSENGFALGSWINKNRQRHHAGQLSPDRIARLEALPGWVWTTRAARSATR
jgi:superfamily II DNA or RNA helicase